MTRARHAITGLTIALLLASAAPGRAQTIYAPETTDRYFQVGDVPMDARAFFSASVAEAASYRVHVVSYDWACQGGGSGM